MLSESWNQKLKMIWNRYNRKYIRTTASNRMVKHKLFYCKPTGYIYKHFPPCGRSKDFFERNSVTNVDKKKLPAVRWYTAVIKTKLKKRFLIIKSNIFITTCFRRETLSLKSQSVFLGCVKNPYTCINGSFFA